MIPPTSLFFLLYLSFMSTNMRAESSQQTSPILYPCPGSHSEDVSHLCPASHTEMPPGSQRELSLAHAGGTLHPLNSFSHTPRLAKEHNTSFYPSSHGDGIAQIRVKHVFHYTDRYSIILTASGSDDLSVTAFERPTTYFCRATLRLPRAYTQQK